MPRDKQTLRREWVEPFRPVRQRTVRSENTKDKAGAPLVFIRENPMHIDCIRQKGLTHKPHQFQRLKVVKALMSLTAHLLLQILRLRRLPNGNRKKIMRRTVMAVIVSLVIIRMMNSFQVKMNWLLMICI